MHLDHPGPRQARGPSRQGSTPTIADVAALAGVSTSTVSKVINSRYGVSRATGRRVQEAVELLQFTPSMAATSLRGGSTRVVGLFAEHLGPWESEVLRGATLAAGDSGYGLLAWVGSGTGTLGQGAPRWASSMVEGAILLADVTTVGLANLPLVLVPAQADPQGPAALDRAVRAPYDLGRRAVRRLLSLLPEPSSSTRHD